MYLLYKYILRQRVLIKANIKARIRDYDIIITRQHIL